MDFDLTNEFWVPIKVNEEGGYDGEEQRIYINVERTYAHQHCALR